MNRRGIPFSDALTEMLKDPEFKEEYNKLGPRYEAISLVIQARIDLKITQEELAQKVGTKKSNISRLESGNYNPSLDFLYKIAKGLGKELHIEFR